MTAVTASGSAPRRRWRWVAQLGFWFFLVKGLLWLAVPIAAAWLGVTL